MAPSVPSGPIPVQIVSGFLGAGKTTAIKAQLRARTGERVAIIVNDFGEAGFDAQELAEDEPFRITSIPGGCVCCTAPEGFVDALGAVLEQAPDRLIVEPTGLARPQDLIDTIRRCAHRDALRLAPTVVLLDPSQLEKQGRSEAADLLRDQARAADVLVANRSDLCSPQELEAFRAFAGELWPGPLATHETRHGEIPTELFDWPEGEGARAPERSSRPSHAHAHAHAHDSTEGFEARSWRWSPDTVFSRERLVKALQGIAGGDLPLARFKGVFRTQEGVSQLEVSGGVLHDRLTSFRRDSRADAIAGGDAAELEAALDRVGRLLEEAVLDESELDLDASRIEVVLPSGAVHGIDRDELLALPDGIDDVSSRFPKRAGAAARVSALLDRLGCGSEGQAVVVAGDGFASEPVPLTVLRKGVLLHSLEGEPLPEKQGGPFRLLIPEEAAPGPDPISCANVKGVAKIVVRAPE